MSAVNASSSALIPLMVIVPIFCGIILNLLHNKDKTVKYIALVVGLILPILPLITNYGLHYFGGYSPLMLGPEMIKHFPTFISSSTLALFHPGITYSFTSMHQIFIFLLGIVAFCSIFTTYNETEKPSGVLGFLIFMGTAAITAIFLSDDIFNLYVFFEIAALTQTGIILCSNVDRNAETALKYMFIGSIAAPLLLIGIALLLGIVGNVNISDMVASINLGLIDVNSPSFLLAGALILFGWLYASGLPPFHTVKSALYSKAFPHGTALLQAFSVLTFLAILFAIMRLFFKTIFITQSVIIIFSILGMILGITMALVQTDFKRMLGYIAVGELGYIGLGFGMGTPLSITAGLFQAANELVITAFLFISFGTIIYKTGISDINKLGGLLSENSNVAILVLISGFAMAGVPPLNGFQSKLLLIQSSIYAGFPEIGVLMILISIITFMVFMKAFYEIYLKQKPDSLKIINKEIPKATIFSMFVLFIICLVLGLFPQMVLPALTNYSVMLLL